MTLNWVAAVAVLTTASTMSLSAQAEQPEHARFVPAIVKSVALDPTTYAPGLITYGAMRLDWNSSQVFFRNGYVEQNADYTITGASNSASVSHGAGNLRIAADSVAILQLSLAHNVTARIFERAMAGRYPTHGKLIRVIARVERIAAGSYLSYAMSAMHFRQWRKNEQVARELGLR